MPTSILCRCGQYLPVHDTSDQNIECCRCGQNIAVVARDRPRGVIWIVSLIALLSSLSTAGLLGYVVGRTHRTKVPITPNVAAVDVAKVPYRSIPEAPLPPAIKTEPTPTVLPTVLPEAPSPEPINPDPVATPPNIEPVPPKVGRLEANREPFGGFKVGDVLTQNVTFLRYSMFQMAGLQLSQGARYSIQSSLTIVKVNADGSFAVEQAILKTKLIEADANVKTNLADALEKAIGAKFEITISAFGIATVKGVKDTIRVQEGQQAALGQTIRVWSLLDADAWKELAGLTFFQPALALRNKATWTKPVTHDWGPLGSWTGKTIYVAGGKPTPKSNHEIIDYGHRIDHSSVPAKAENQLPFQLLKVKFTPTKADGRVIFNPDSQRTVSAEEQFRVHGVITAQIAGSSADVELLEYQSFQLSITETNEAKLVAQPNKQK